jgi:hypothetical protein
VPVDELSEVFVQALGKRVITPVMLGALEPKSVSNVVALRPTKRTAVRPQRTARAVPKRGR